MTYGWIHDLIASQDEALHCGQSAYKLLLVPHEGHEIIDAGEKDGAPANILKGGPRDNDWITLFDRKVFKDHVYEGWFVGNVSLHGLSHPHQTADEDEGRYLHVC